MNAFAVHIPAPPLLPNANVDMEMVNGESLQSEDVNMPEEKERSRWVKRMLNKEDRQSKIKKLRHKLGLGM